MDSGRTPRVGDPVAWTLRFTRYREDVPHDLFDPPETFAEFEGEAHTVFTDSRDGRAIVLVEGSGLAAFWLTRGPFEGDGQLRGRLQVDPTGGPTAVAVPLTEGRIRRVLKVVREFQREGISWTPRVGRVKVVESDEQPSWVPDDADERQWLFSELLVDLEIAP